MKGIEHHQTGGASFTGKGIDLLRLTTMLRCLKMETKGLKMVRWSVYAQVKRELGFKGSKQSVYDQLLAHVQNVMRENQASQADVDALLDVGKL